MTIRHLDQLFQPQTVAVIGASSRPGSVGALVLRNLTHGGFKGRILAVNPRHEAIGGVPVVPDIARLPVAPDLAIVCTPPATVPAIITALGERGARAAMVLAARMQATTDADGVRLQDAMLRAARPYRLRILGGNCVGLLTPAIGLNAGLVHAGGPLDDLAGKIAFISQSGAVATGILDWATSRGIGFSKLVALGDAADVDVGDCLDYLARDPQTQAILLYIEEVADARKFMSAARGAARGKPVMVLKAGRTPQAGGAGASHARALAGRDDVYDAAIRRAGMLRVAGMEEMFAAVEALAHARPLVGERLTIVANGAGPGLLAADALRVAGGTLSVLGDATRDRLDAILPRGWSCGNPVTVPADAPGPDAAAIDALLDDPQADALLFVQVPGATASSAGIAAQAAPVLARSGRTVLACCLGGDAVRQARRIFFENGIPAYDTPEEAVRAFMQMVQYRRNQGLLMQVPASLPCEFLPDRAAARAVTRAALAAGRELLSEPETKTVLAAYGIPVVATRIAATIDEAVAAAVAIGFPIALKVLSPHIRHKSDVGGVVLDIETPQAVATAAAAIRRRLAERMPRAVPAGFSVQAMARRAAGHELIVGASTDPVFGPVILFGAGGVAVEVMHDTTIGLPPLNMVLARDMVSRTRVAALLAGYRGRRGADIEAICRTLVMVGHLVTDLPEILELDINPLVADADGVIVLDAGVRLARPGAGDGVARLAIRPYPQELEQSVTWGGAALLLRPIRPEDGAAHLRFVGRLDPEDVRLRMFVGMRELPPAQLARFTQIDYDREMAFIATRTGADGQPETLGVARVIVDPDNIEGEFAVIVRSDLKSRGLGTLLMEKLIAYCRLRGTRAIVGEALTENTGLRRLAQRLGFSVQPFSDHGVRALRLDLRAPEPGPRVGSPPVSPS